MNKHTLEALKGSIAKWEAIVADEEHDLGILNCPLCKKFKNNDPECSGCPVAERAEAPCCRNTPYDAWCDTNTGSDVRGLYNYQRNIRLRTGEKLPPVDPKLVALAQAELDFLKSLLPKEAP